MHTIGNAYFNFVSGEGLGGMDAENFDYFYPFVLLPFFDQWES